MATVLLTNCETLHFANKSVLIAQLSAQFSDCRQTSTHLLLEREGDVGGGVGHIGGSSRRVRHGNPKFGR
ncbi:hypothetical protein Y032_0471g2055 [Ancylostoma ceylanicum]|uniref:Uncharacterized protein n=1 Tax=Ancylostoma ceylanicum TaxID=53326 RepID=A0A016WWF3_9BILA|nr:hypothetical protein Y032_0471g2055 [Ancylostoma ceylanicum]